MRSKDLILPGLLLLLVAAVAWAFLARPSEPDVRFPAPDLAIRTADGVVSLKDLRGKVVLVDFWATWCGPCRESMPAVEGFYNEFHARGLEVLGASTDDAGTARAVGPTIKELGITYPAGQLVSLKMAADYRVEGIPYMVLVDRQGQVRLTQTGYGPSVEAKLATKIESLLKE